MNFGVCWIAIMWIIVTVDEIGCAVSGDFESLAQVDLLKALGVFNRNLSDSREGVAITNGPYGVRPAIKLFGDRRGLRVPEIETRKVLNILRSSVDVTFIAHIQQEELNTGVLISYAEDFTRYFELQSSGRKDEIRLHYLHKGRVFVESFPYRLSDARWHHLAVTLSDSEVTVFVDCQQVYKRVIKKPDRDFEVSGKNVSLWVGQRGDDHFLFQGSIQDVRIISGSNGHLVQCPAADSSCPTCGQFSSLQRTVSELENYVRELASKLHEAEQRLNKVEECECRKSCSVNDTVKSDGEKWRNGCDECTCRGGDVSCKRVGCPVTNCKNPVLRPGDCCPVCLKRCVSGGVWYDHGEKEASKGCKISECRDGIMKTVTLNPAEICPPLSCPPAEQVSKQGECCKFCIGADYCAKGHDCHSNASCINLRTEFMCQCESGFYGDGRNCSDIDECSTYGGKEGHMCGNNTVCVNTVGSYKCECLEGFSRWDNYTCAEIDECETGGHDCHVNAHCTNLVGSFKCDCAVGYEGDGKNCTPICSSPCQNGGFCRTPEQCSCRAGFTGPYCEQDLDECALGMHKCDSNSECVNKHGWYDCKCKTGYRSVLIGTENATTSCVDVDECTENTHTCHDEHECVNTDGRFMCKCSGTLSSNCSIGCATPVGLKPHLSVWLPTEPCTVCSCDNGVTKCRPLPCSCDTSATDSVASLELQLVVEKFLANQKVAKTCCKHCETRAKEFCVHQEDKRRIFQQGEVWVHHCQMCECLHGETDCWSLECPPVACDNPTLLPGDCCPRCPDDPCAPVDFSNSTSTNDTDIGCHYGGEFYKDGVSWVLDEDPCTSCSCKNGHACCRFNPACPARMSGAFLSEFKQSAIKKALKDIVRKTTGSPSGRFSKTTPQEYMASVRERSKRQPPRLRRNARIKRQGMRTRNIGEKKEKMSASGKIISEKSVHL